MKNILVPTDFSACATNAVKASLNMADYYGATLHLFSNLSIRKDWALLSESDRQMETEDLQKIHNAEQLFKEWEEIARDRNINIQSAWSAGSLIENINTYIVNNGIDFIVMGSHGTSGKNKYMIGSNTQKVVRKVHCPVLIVKNNIDNYEIKKVIFASNFDLVEQKPFKYLLDFVRPINPEIYLIQINTSGWFTQPYILVKEAMADFKKLGEDAGFKTLSFFKRDLTVEEGIRAFAEEIDADLIVISNQQRHPVKRLFAGSTVELLVNHADIPVLSIDFPKDK